MCGTDAALTSELTVRSKEVEGFNFHEIYYLEPHLTLKPVYSLLVSHKDHERRKGFAQNKRSCVRAASVDMGVRPPTELG